jgi:hypothetical protein
MARPSRDIGHLSLTLSVDECRVRLQTGEATLFVDARRAADWEASADKVVGAWRVDPDLPLLALPCGKEQTIAVYCA